jgi:hypothetical protein
VGSRDDDVHEVDTQRSPSLLWGASRTSPATVAALALVTAIVTGFGIIVVGNDLGPVLADPSLDRSLIWWPLAVKLCLPVAAIVGAAAVATVTGSRRPSSALAAGAVTFGVVAGTGVGRVLWRSLEIQTYGTEQGLLDATAVLALFGATGAGGVAGALIGDRLQGTPAATRASQWSTIFATALLTYPTLQLVAGQSEVGERQLWMLGFMLFAIGITPRIGLLLAEGQDAPIMFDRRRLYDLHAERDQSAAIRLVIGFSAGWMASILVNMSAGGFDGQLTRYVLSWGLPLALMAPGILAHLDRLAPRRPAEPALVRSAGR